MSRRLIDADAMTRKLNVFNDRMHGNEHFLNGIETAKEIIKNEPTVDIDDVPQWIPCSERLPKMKEIVLITNDKGHVRCGQYSGVGFFSKNDGRPHWNWKGNTLETVVAWMPLPKPYEVEE